jgi:hypothetical protein
VKAKVKSKKEIDNLVTESEELKKILGSICAKTKPTG